MKKSLIVIGLSFLPLGHAQTVGTPSVPPAGVPLRVVMAENPAQLKPAEFEITASWSEKTKGKLSVALANPSDKALKVLGVQASSGIFIIDYPDKVKAKGEEKINFIYDAADNSENPTEVIRVKTDQGIKALHVQIKREAAVHFSKKEVHWKVGAKAETKMVTLQVSAGNVVPLRAKVSSGEHHAEIEKIDSTSYRVKITPSTTAQATQFSVVIEFDQALPGVAPVIVASVGE